MDERLKRILPPGALGLVFLLYSVAMFMIFGFTNVPLWVGYGCTLLAFLLTGTVFWIKAPDLWDVRDDLYQTPIVVVCIAYDLAAMVLSVISALLPTAAIKWIVLAELLFLVVFLILVVVAIMSANKLIQMHKDSNNSSKELGRMESRLKTIAHMTDDPQLAQQIRHLAEDMHFSDLSLKAMTDMQDQMLNRSISELENSVKYGDMEHAAMQLHQLEIDLKARNRENKLG